MLTVKIETKPNNPALVTIQRNLVNAIQAYNSACMHANDGRKVTNALLEVFAAHCNSAANTAMDVIVR